MILAVVLFSSVIYSNNTIAGKVKL